MLSSCENLLQNLTSRTLHLAAGLAAGLDASSRHDLKYTCNALRVAKGTEYQDNGSSGKMTLLQRSKHVQTERCKCKHLNHS